MKRKKAQFISAEAIYNRTADPSPAQAVANHETKKNSNYKMLQNMEYKRIAVFIWG